MSSANFVNGLLRTKAGLKESSAKGRLGGRKRKLTKDQIAIVAKLIGSGRSITDVADVVGTSRATIYRTFPGGLNIIREAFEKEGQKGLDDAVESVVRQLGIGSQELLKEKVLLMHNVDRLPANHIAEQTGLNRETVRRYIREGT